uniref:Dihydrolipoyl dehydrogenase n=1 Tax=Synechococcus elongatus (strain ATCC 33912 / PCC 7942 / FACHB-805) TaxID=1140 RepID=Q8KPR5_SYNE7|nr:PhdD [Synechococcus elongatus PCC 7942 = FACHB-805]
MSSEFDYDVIVIGAGYGGFDAAKHACEKGLKTAIVEARDLGGTCVNRGCVPSKALLAASGRVREITDTDHLQNFGIQVQGVSFDRQAIADHAANLVDTVRTNLGNTLKRLGAEILMGRGRLAGSQRVTVTAADGTEKTYSARDVILATGSDPFVPPGIEIDGKTVFTSDDALKLETLPQWIAIIGSGYIGLEFSDVYTALGCEVTMIEALDRLLPTFDPDVAESCPAIAAGWSRHRNPHGCFGAQNYAGSPVVIELADFETKELVEVLEVDACLVATGRIPSTKNLGLETVAVEVDRRGFIPVDDGMRVLRDSKPVPHLFAVGDATGKLMLAHAAAAQGVVAIENITGHPRSVDYRSIPAATFTHPEISSVGLSEADAKALGGQEGFEVGSVRSYFKANSKALAEADADGFAKVLFRKDTGEVLGAHIFGLHAADLIQEVANAIARRQSVKELAFEVHTHPTLSEVIESAYKQAATAIA